MQDKDSKGFTLVHCYRGGEEVWMNINEIIHVFSSPTTGVHLVMREANQEYHTSLTLKKLDDSSHLVRCHRQHMVNPDYIKWIKKLNHGLGEIQTYGGHTIPVSRNFMGGSPPIV